MPAHRGEISIGAGDFAPEIVLADAREQSGFDDFGDDSFRPRS
jgi:hypothetical protein